MNGLELETFFLQKVQLFIGRKYGCILDIEYQFNKVVGGYENII